MATKLLPPSLAATASASFLSSRSRASSWARSFSKRARLSGVARSAFFCGNRKLRANPSLTLTTSPIGPRGPMRCKRMTCMLLLHRLTGRGSGGGRRRAEAAPELEGRLEQPGERQGQRDVRPEQHETCVHAPQQPGCAGPGNEMHEGKTADQVGEEQSAGEAGACDSERAGRERGGDGDGGKQREARRIGEGRQVGPGAAEPARGPGDASGEVEVDREDGHPVGGEGARQGGDDELAQRLD